MRINVVHVFMTASLKQENLTDILVFLRLNRRSVLGQEHFMENYKFEFKEGHGHHLHDLHVQNCFGVAIYVDTGIPITFVHQVEFMEA